MKKIILTIILVYTYFVSGAQTLIVNPQNNIYEGGEIALLPSNSSFNDWRIDNYRGYLRFHHSGRSYFNLSGNGNLSVQGKIEATQVKVTNSPTADFVFEEDYDLPSLSFIENHIKTKKHLPEIASAKKMKEEGVNIGDFQIQLLQKIEELTLYTIQQQKEIQRLQQQNARIEQQEQEILFLKAQLKKLIGSND